MNPLSRNVPPGGHNGHVAHTLASSAHSHAPAGMRFLSSSNPPPEHHPSSGQNNRAPTSDDASVGRRIKEERRKAGRTQKDVAGIIGVTGAQFHRYEAGTTRVATSRLMMIAATLNIRPELLMGVSISQPVELPLVLPGCSGTDDLVELVEIFGSIGDARRRHALIVLARVIATDAPKVEPSGEERGGA